jgi:hypothetical protein
MSKARNAPLRPAYVPPSRIVWTEERLAVLDKAQLRTLLDNLQVQRSSGRVAEETAAELEQRIRSRLPAPSAAPRRKRRSRDEIRLEVRAAEQLGDFAAGLARRYDVSADTALRVSSDTKGFRPEAMTDSKGHARAGAAVKNGIAAIERYVAYRSRESFAALAFVLLADRPQQDGCYVLLATDDLIDDEQPADEFAPIAGQHGWSAHSRARMRARPVSGFEEGAQRYEALIARLAAPHG